MGIESGLVELLDNDAPLTTLVSLRCYAHRLPQNVTLPAILWQVISNIPLSALDGDSGQAHARIQVTVVDDSPLSMIAVAAAIKTALVRYRGAADDVTILDIKLENETDGAYTDAVDDYTRHLDFFIEYHT